MPANQASLCTRVDAVRMVSHQQSKRSFEHVPHAEEKDDEGDVAMRHRVPGREVVLEFGGEANEGPQDAVERREY